MNVIPILQDDAHYEGRTDIPEKFVLEGKPSYENWLTRELPASGKLRTGLWTGEAGTLTMRKYPTDEVCTVIYGKIEITNEDGSVVVLTPGESVLVPKGWSGTWRNVEKSCKCYASVG